MQSTTNLFLLVLKLEPLLDQVLLVLPSSRAHAFQLHIVERRVLLVVREHEVDASLSVAEEHRRLVDDVRRLQQYKLSSHDALSE